MSADRSYGVTVTVIESELIMVLPLVYCANNVVLPAAFDCTHIGSI
jgi:hypothetical protein